MKEDANYGLDPAKLQAAIIAYNAMDIATVTIPTEGHSDDVLAAMFLAAVHSIPGDSTKLVSDEVRAYYKEELPEAIFDDVSNADEAQLLGMMEAKVQHDCPVFGKQNPAEPDCQDCKNEFAAEFEACTKQTAANAAAAETKPKGKGGRKKKVEGAAKPVKEKKVKEPKAPKEPKEKVITKRSRYGHAVGSMSGDIDNAVWQGGHIESISAWLAAKHDRELAAARAKIRGHVNHLIQNKAVTVLETAGVLKAQVEFAKGYDENNTACEAVELPAYTPPAPAPAAEETPSVDATEVAE